MTIRTQQEADCVFGTVHAIAAAAVGAVFTAALPSIGAGLVVGALTSAFLNSWNEDLEIARSLSDAIDRTAAKYWGIRVLKAAFARSGRAASTSSTAYDSRKPPREGAGAGDGGDGNEPSPDYPDSPYHEPDYDDDDQEGASGGDGDGHDPDVGGMITSSSDKNTGEPVQPPTGDEEEYPGEKDHQVKGAGSN